MSKDAQVTKNIGIIFAIVAIVIYLGRSGRNKPAIQ